MVYLDTPAALGQIFAIRRPPYGSSGQTWLHAFVPLNIGGEPVVPARRAVMPAFTLMSRSSSWAAHPERR